MVAFWHLYLGFLTLVNCLGIYVPTRTVFTANYSNFHFLLLFTIKKRPAYIPEHCI